MAWIKTYAVKSGPRYRVFWRDPAGNVQSRVFKHKADARACRTAVEQAVGEGTYTDPRRGRVALRECWEDFITAPPTPLAPSTRSLYSMQWRLYIRPHLGDRRINTIQPEEVRQFLSALAASGVGPSSVNSAHRLLRRLLSLALSERRIAYNPAVGVKAPKPEDREMRFLTNEEVTAIAGEMPQPYHALVLTLAFGGLRIGEASALRNRNLDNMTGRVAIVEAASEVDGVRHVGSTKTGQKRVVVLPRFVRDVVVGHLAKFGSPKDPESLVFATPDGGPVSQRSFRRTFVRAARRANVTPVPRVHDLRHTAVALAIEAGAHAKQIQEMMGHASIKTTFDTYGHLFPALQEDVANRLDALYRDRQGKSEGGTVVNLGG